MKREARVCSGLKYTRKESDHLRGSHQKKKKQERILNVLETKKKSTKDGVAFKRKSLLIQKELSLAT